VTKLVTDHKFQTPGGGVATSIFGISDLLIPVIHFSDPSFTLFNSETKRYDGHPMHWSMIHVDMTQQTIMHYDSLNALALDSEYTNAILDFITDQALLYQTNAGTDALAVDALDRRKWKTVRAQESPQQTGFNDCGVYAIMVAAYRIMGLAPNFTPSDIPHFRALITSSLLQKAFIPSLA
jgi:Ulp1 protease family, C-terminal catalytic domain